MTPEQLPAAIREAIEKVVEYSWDDEIDDYREQVEMCEDVQDHVFGFLVTLKNFVDGTDTAADEFVSLAADETAKAYSQGSPVTDSESESEASPPPSSIVPTFLVDFTVADDRGRLPVNVFKRLDSKKFGDFTLRPGMTVNLSDGEVTMPSRVEEVKYEDGSESDWVAVPFGHR